MASKPDDYSQITPYLTVSDVNKSISFWDNSICMLVDHDGYKWNFATRIAS